MWYRLFYMIAISVVVLSVNAVANELSFESIRASMRAEREKIRNGHCTGEFTIIKRRGGGYNTDGEPIAGEGSFERTARAYQHEEISWELEFDLDADTFLFERHINIKAPLGLSASKRESDGLNGLVRVLFGQSRDRAFKFTDRERKTPWLESVTRENVDKLDKSHDRFFVPRLRDVAFTRGGLFSYIDEGDESFFEHYYVSQGAEIHVESLAGNIFRMWIVTGGTPETQSSIDLWVDADRGFTPFKRIGKTVKLEDGEEIVKSEKLMEWEEIGGAWFPIAMRRWSRSNVLKEGVTVLPEEDNPAAMLKKIEEVEIEYRLDFQWKIANAVAGLAKDYQFSDLNLPSGTMYFEDRVRKRVPGVDRDLPFNEAEVQTVHRPVESRRVFFKVFVASVLVLMVLVVYFSHRKVKWEK
jgi:hypothetical protein